MRLTQNIIAENFDRIEQLCLNFARDNGLKDIRIEYHMFMNNDILSFTFIGMDGLCFKRTFEKYMIDLIISDNMAMDIIQEFLTKTFKEYSKQK